MVSLPAHQEQLIHLSIVHLTTSEKLPEGLLHSSGHLQQESKNPLSSLQQSRFPAGDPGAGLKHFRCDWDDQKQLFIWPQNP